MPRAAHFGPAVTSGRPLALPRPEACPAVGGYCRIARDGRDLLPWDLESELDGPLSLSDYGYVLEDTGDAARPYKVQELESGHIWWYQEHHLESVPEAQVPEQLRNPKPPDDGDYVTLVPGYQQYTDAARGPLSLQRTDNAFGMIVLASGNRFRVRACNPAGERAEWWYDREAVRKVAVQYVPEHLRDALRPGWGDYCVLTSDYGAFAGAAGGPLDEGNLGVVVGVDARPDAEGGLDAPRYVVRACHNGLLHRYHEGAVHPVVLQLLHDEKIPPTNMTDRMDKLLVSLTLLEAPPDGVTAAAAAAGAPLGCAGRECGTVRLRRMMPGCPSLAELTCQEVVPGKRYWLKASLFCKDDDLMLASLKPISWDIFAPCGIAGEFRPLRPVHPALWSAAQQQQQRRPPCLTAPTQHQTHLCPEALSLAACRAGTRCMQWGEGAGGSGKRAHDAWRSSRGLEAGPGRLGEASASGGAGGPWYLPYEDKLLGVFEWDTAEAPLVMQPGGVTTVQFCWDILFADLQPRAGTNVGLLLSTTTNVADITAALNGAAGRAQQQQQQLLPTVMFEHMARPPAAAAAAGNSSGPPAGGVPTPDPGAPQPGHASSSSSSSAEGSASADGSSDAGSSVGEEGEGEGEGEQHSTVGSEFPHGEDGEEEDGVWARLAANSNPPEPSAAAEGAAAAAGAQGIQGGPVVPLRVQPGAVAVICAGAAVAAVVGAAGTAPATPAAAAGAAAAAAAAVELEEVCLSAAEQQQQQQEEVCSQLISTPSCSEWICPEQQPADSQAAADGASSTPPTASDTAAAGGGAAGGGVSRPASAPTTPLAAAGAAASLSVAAGEAGGDGRGRRGSSSCSSSPTSSSGVQRHRHRSFSCDDRRPRGSSSSGGSSGGSSSRPKALAGVAFTSFAAATAAAAAAGSGGSGSSSPTAAGCTAAAAAGQGVSAPAAAATAAGSVEATPAAAAAPALGHAQSSDGASSSVADTPVCGRSSSVAVTPAGPRRDPLAAVAARPAAAAAATFSRSDSGSSATAALRPSGGSSSSSPDAPAAAGSSNSNATSSSGAPLGSSSSSSSGSAITAAAGGDDQDVPFRRVRPSPPVLPVLGPGSISSRDSASGSERSARSSSTTPTASGRGVARPSSSSTGSRHRGASSSASGGGSSSRQAPAAAAASSSSSGRSRRQSSSGSGTPVARHASGSSTPVGGGSRPLTPTAAAVTPRSPQQQQQQQQQPLGPGVSSINEIMEQLDRQAEAHQPFWAEGTEAAAQLASAAYDAAVEWHQHWRRPGRM